MSNKKENKSQLNSFKKAEEIIQSLPSSYHYFNVYPYSSLGDNSEKAPYILVYKYTDKLTFGQLITQYAKQIKENKDTTVMRFYLKNKEVLKSEYTLKQMKKELRVSTLSGLDVYFRILMGLIDECNKIQVMYSLQFKGFIQVPFVLTDINYPIYIPLSEQKNETHETVVGKLLEEIKRIFGYKPTPQIIRLSAIQDQELKVNEEIHFNWLTDNDKVKVNFLKGFKIKAPPRPNNSYVIIKGVELKVKSTKLHYDDIKGQKVKDVLSLIDDDTDWNQYGIKIEDYFLKPEETFSKADNLLKNTTTVFKNVAAIIIKESLVFEGEQENIRTIGGKVPIQQISYSHPTNEQHRRECLQKAEDRARNANMSYFKQNLNSVKPILLYTSQLIVVPSNKALLPILLYSHLNTFMRMQYFGITTSDDYKNKWEYSFASEIIQQLKHIKPITNKAIWRGIKYSPKYQKDERVVYKQFLSCSINQQVAKSFAETGLIKITKSFSGKPIKEFSFFQEDEVLFEPYSEFIVTKVSTIQKSQGWTNINIPFIEMEEIPRPSMPDSRNIFLLWVDDKTIQGQYIWETIEDISKTTVMNQLLSTKALKGWLQTNEDLVKDESTKVVLISNMTRQENGVLNPIAGIEGIQQFRKKIPNGQICLYIGDLQKAFDKLQDNNLKESEKLWVTNEEDVLRNFMKQISELQ